MTQEKLAAVVLNKMIRYTAMHTPECEQCIVGSVVRIAADETACNWNVSRIEGANSGECLVAMADFIASLRARFLLMTDEEMDPTLLTTWAMR